MWGEDLRPCPQTLLISTHGVSEVMMRMRMMMAELGMLLFLSAALLALIFAVWFGCPNPRSATLAVTLTTFCCYM